MKTSINGKPAIWTADILRMWRDAMRGVEDSAPVSESNYFTPRHHRNQYDRGSNDHGFTYTRGRHVFVVKVAG